MGYFSKEASGWVKFVSAVHIFPTYQKYSKTFFEIFKPANQKLMK